MDYLLIWHRIPAAQGRLRTSVPQYTRAEPAPGDFHPDRLSLDDDLEGITRVSFPIDRRIENVRRATNDEWTRRQVESQRIPIIKSAPVSETPRRMRRPAWLATHTVRRDRGARVRVIRRTAEPCCEDEVG